MAALDAAVGARRRRPGRRRAGGRWLAALAVTVALTLFAGHPHTAGFAIALAGAFALATASPGRSRGRAVLGVSVAIGLGALLAAIQLWPFLEYFGMSRGALLRGAFELNPYHAQVDTLITALVPDFLGNHSVGNFIGATNYLEQMSYPGAVVWVLAAVGLVTGRRDWRVWFFAAAAGFALLVFYGAPGVLHLISRVPLLGSASLPRIAVVETAALVVLAGYGAAAVLGHSAGRDARHHRGVGDCRACSRRPPPRSSSTSGQET